MDVWVSGFRCLYNADLRVPNGVFALTGESGSGKTTLISAVAWVLYGQNRKTRDVCSTKDHLSPHGLHCAGALRYCADGAEYAFLRISQIRDGRFGCPPPAWIPPAAIAAVDAEIRDAAQKRKPLSYFAAWENGAPVPDPKALCARHFGTQEIFSATATIPQKQASYLLDAPALNSVVDDLIFSGDPRDSPGRYLENLAGPTTEAARRAESARTELERAGAIYQRDAASAAAGAQAFGTLWARAAPGLPPNYDGLRQLIKTCAPESPLAAPEADISDPAALAAAASYLRNRRDTLSKEITLWRQRRDMLQGARTALASLPGSEELRAEAGRALEELRSSGLPADPHAAQAAIAQAEREIPLRAERSRLAETLARCPLPLKPGGEPFSEVAARAALCDASVSAAARASWARLLASHNTTEDTLAADLAASARADLWGEEARGRRAVATEAQGALGNLGAALQALWEEQAAATQREAIAARQRNEAAAQQYNARSAAYAADVRARSAAAAAVGAAAAARERLQALEAAAVLLPPGDVAHGAVGTECGCPSCGARVYFVNGALVKTALTPEAAAEARAAHERAKSAYAAQESGLAGARQAAASAAGAAQALSGACSGEPLPHPGPAPAPEPIPEIRLPRRFQAGPLCAADPGPGRQERTAVLSGLLASRPPMEQDAAGAALAQGALNHYAAAAALARHTEEHGALSVGLLPGVLARGKAILQEVSRLTSLADARDSARAAAEAHAAHLEGLLGPEVVVDPLLWESPELCERAAEMFLLQRRAADSYAAAYGAQKSQEAAAQDSLCWLRAADFVRDTRLHYISDSLAALTAAVNLFLTQFFNDHVAYALSYGQPAGKNVEPRLLSTLSVGSRGDVDPASLSGGESDRFSLAVAAGVALWRCTPFLIFDETIASLDPESRYVCVAAVARLLPGRPVLFVTHDPPPGLFADSASMAEVGARGVEAQLRGAA